MLARLFSHTSSLWAFEFNAGSTHYSTKLCMQQMCTCRQAAVHIISFKCVLDWDWDSCLDDRHRKQVKRALKIAASWDNKGRACTGIRARSGHAAATGSPPCHKQLSHLWLELETPRGSRGAPTIITCVSSIVMGLRGKTLHWTFIQRQCLWGKWFLSMTFLITAHTHWYTLILLGTIEPPHQSWWKFDEMNFSTFFSLCFL